MPDCRALAETLASWGGSCVPARVVQSEGQWTKASVRRWPAVASSRPDEWRADWFTWGGTWWVAVCPRVGGLVCLDLDGPEAVDALRRSEGVLSGGELIYRTPGHGGGMHVWWRWPRAMPPFSRVVATLPAGGEVDLRGEAGFVLMCGAPRPDLPPGARYELVKRPGSGGPPPAPSDLRGWVESLGPSTSEAAPVHQGKQLSPEGLAATAAAQGGRVTQDRHTTLFRVCSWLRVRKETNTFETLAAELWRLFELHFDAGEEGEEHWQSEVIRVSRNAREYTERRDQERAEASAAAMRALGIEPQTTS